MSGLDQEEIAVSFKAQEEEALVVLEEEIVSENDETLLMRIWKEVKVQAKTAIPTIYYGMATNKIPSIASIYFAGQLGDAELAAFGLATTLSNVTGMSLSVGLTSALTTLTGQAKGDLSRRANNNDQEEPLMGNVDEPLITEEDDLLLPVVYLYRGLFVQLLFLVPIGVWWVCFGIRPALEALGQEASSAEATSRYLAILYGALLGYAANFTLCTWLQAMDLADVPAHAATFGLLLHVPCNYLFVHVWKWGIDGVAWAVVVNRAIQALYCFAYTIWFGQGRLQATLHHDDDAIWWRRGGWEMRRAIGSWRGVSQYLGLALPGVVMISEWWASEAAVFLSGRLQPHPDLALDAMTIYQAINTLCFMLPSGYSTAIAVRVGHLLGHGHGNARFAAVVGVTTAALLSALAALALLWTPHTFFPSFFSPESRVVLEASHTITLLAVYVLADGIQTCLSGVIRGCARQCVTIPIVIVAYWTVGGVPLAYYFSFVRNKGVMQDGCLECGVSGLVLGMTTGTWLHMLLLACVVVFTTNWQLEAQKAKQRLETK